MRQSWQRKTLHNSSLTSSNILKTLLQYLYFIVIQMLLEINYVLLHTKKNLIRSVLHMEVWIHMSPKITVFENYDWSSNMKENYK